MRLPHWLRKPDRSDAAQEQAAFNRQLLKAVETMALALQQSVAENAKVMQRFLGFYEIASPPEVRMHGDDYKFSLTEQSRLKAAGFPVDGSEREQLEWMLLNPDGTRLPLER